MGKKSIAETKMFTNLYMPPINQFLPHIFIPITQSTPFSSNNRSNTRRCVTSISSLAYPATNRLCISSQKPARHRLLVWKGLVASILGIGELERADKSTGTMLGCQSKEVPMRSKNSAFGLGPVKEGKG